VSLAAVVTLTVTLFVFGALWLGGAFLNSSLEAVKTKVDISVSLKPDAKEADAQELKQSLEKLPEVKSVSYRSREQEFEDFKKRNQDNDLILQSLEEVGNPFGARLNIQAIDPEHYETIANFLESDDALGQGGVTVIDQVSFKKNVVDRLVALIATSQRVALAITIVLIFISIVVTFNTISLAIYISREEIALMKLVGSSDNYIRGPFVVEGSIAGLISAALATALLYPATMWVRNVTSGVFGGVNLVSYFIEHGPVLFLLLVAIGVGLGIVSSFLAVRKHLRI
jgi:cell division transport system permease protein